MTSFNKNKTSDRISVCKFPKYMAKIILVSLVICKGEQKMIVGYARVSKEWQSINRQLDLLKENHAEEIIQEKISGTKKERPGIDQLMLMVRSGDQVMVES